MGIVSQILPETVGSYFCLYSRTKAIQHGLSLHAVVLKTGMQSDVIVTNHMINMYAKCGKINFARKLFDEMSQRNLVSWSAMISSYNQAEEPRMAVDLFSKMVLVPNEYILSSAISACSSLLALKQGQQIHGQSVKLGYSSVSFVSNSLISMYMKCGRCSEALSVFNGASELNSVSYNALIMGLVENQQHEEGFKIFKQMCQQGYIPDRFTYVGALEICSIECDTRKGMQVHCQTIKLKLDSTTFVGNVIITMYSTFNMIEDAEKAFRLIQEKDIISWNTLITTCSHCNDHAKGLSIFKEMATISSLLPDDFTYTSALAVCTGIASVHHGKQIHARLIRTEQDEEVAVGNALVNMYAKCGCIGYAYATFNHMAYRNLVSWNSIIAGFGNHGFGIKALELYEQMKEIGLKPDSVTFITILTACNHAGLVKEGQAYFNSMDEIYGIAPDLEHFSCLIDLLGRAGKLKEAKGYMDKFPFGHDPIVLGSLLSACRLHGDIFAGEDLARKLLKHQLVTSSPYILLSNLYASEGQWDSVVEARKMLKGSGVKKNPGHSLIEVKGVIEKFTIDDFSHVRIEEIVRVLKSLFQEEDEIFSYD
ncbi:hypothetical protein NMG60_11029699 [Bertholletia excelsa]